MDIGIVVERSCTDNPWQPSRWSVVDVLAGVPAAEPGVVLAQGPGWARYYAGPAVLQLFRGETSGYLDNLTSSRPAIYIVLRRSDLAPGIVIHEATVDPGEIEAHSDAGDDLIEAFPLPVAVAAWMQSFIDRHHVERPFHKRQRNRPDTEALARRRAIRSEPPS